jgi:DnaK suppressor protein
VRSSRRGAKAPAKYAAIRKDLMRQRAALLAEAGTVLTSRQQHVAAPDLTDQAQAEVERNFVLRLKEREQKLLKKIDQAVQRIDNGTFGICRGCGTEIPLPRLQARPVTDLCIECKTKQEQDENIRAIG